MSELGYQTFKTDRAEYFIVVHRREEFYYARAYLIERGNLVDIFEDDALPGALSNDNAMHWTKNTIRLWEENHANRSNNS